MILISSQPKVGWMTLPNSPHLSFDTCMRTPGGYIRKSLKAFKCFEAVYWPLAKGKFLLMAKVSLATPLQCNCTETTERLNNNGSCMAKLVAN